jgi:hypothetical protein
VSIPRRAVATGGDVTDGMRPPKMSELHERLTRAARALETARKERNELIVKASEAGISRRRVARAVGLSPAGVQHILARHRGDDGNRP